MTHTLQTMFDKIDRLAGTNSDSYTPTEKTQDLNDFVSELVMEAGFSDSDSEWDDPRFTNANGGRPTGTVDLEEGQPVYSFYKDEDQNRILSIYKIVHVGNSGERRTLVRGMDFDIQGSNIILEQDPLYDRVIGQNKNLLEIYYTRESLGFDENETDEESPFPADFDKFLIYRCVAEWALSEAEDPSMRAKADRYEAKADKIKPRFKKWLQRYYGRGLAVLRAPVNNLR